MQGAKVSKVSKVLGLDTSNYTTSAAILDTENMCVNMKGRLLPVAAGAKGLRQSDAVFHHTKQLPQVIEQLGEDISGGLSGIGVSVKPRLEEVSYMPCFLVGEGLARSLGCTLGIVPDITSHQIGHILAALFSANRLDLLGRRFAAFHVSGGTTDLLMCSYDEEDLLDIKRIGGSNDLKAGQAIDRLGVMLGLDFPCGIEIEKLALKSQREFKIRPSVRGFDCSLSGIENKCRKMLADGQSKEDIALFCLMSVYSAINALTDELYRQYGDIPVLYAGGVMSDKIIRGLIEDKDRIFCEPEFSRDNACGVALYSALKRGLVK